MERRPTQPVAGADLPVLSTRRACHLADCARTTLQRRGPAPVGKRGRTFFYATSDVLAWVSSMPAANAPPRTRAPDPARLPTAASTNALERLRRVTQGGAA